MKNTFSSGRLSYSYTPRIHGNVLTWVKPAPQLDNSKSVIENILRWEDDGGQMLDPGNVMAGSYPDTARAREKE